MGKQLRLIFAMRSTSAKKKSACRIIACIIITCTLQNKVFGVERREYFIVKLYVTSAAKQRGQKYSLFVFIFHK